jgi:hypothetical protein
MFAPTWMRKKQWLVHIKASTANVLDHGWVHMTLARKSETRSANGSIKCAAISGESPSRATLQNSPQALRPTLQSQIYNLRQ